jgi:hypothetical protein
MTKSQQYPSFGKNGIHILQLGHTILALYTSLVQYMWTIHTYQERVLDQFE